MVLVLGSSAVLAAILGARLGLDRAALTESDVIEALAAAYVTETGGARTDCHGVPAPDPAWITVVCGPDGAWSRSVDRAGRVVPTPAPRT
ncbi:MAG: hypothetical protein ACU0CO_10560 [Shimia sp.]